MRATIRFTLPAGVDPAELPAALRPLAENARDHQILLRSEAPLIHVHLLAEWALARGLDLPDLDVHRPTLEDVYLDLTDH